MPKFKLVALSTPVVGKEEQFHQWYDQHLSEVIALPGGRSAQRYRLVAKLSGSDANQYLATYDIECDDSTVFLGALGEALAQGKLTQTDANDLGVMYSALFEELGEKIGS